MDIVSHTVNQDQEGATRLLSQVKEAEDTPALEVKLSGIDEVLKLSEEGSALFLELLAFLAAGKTLTIVADDSMMTIAEAAQMLNVSSEYVAKLIEEERLVAHEREEEYCLLRSSVVTHDEKMKKMRKEGLTFLTAESQEMNLF
ncbi:MAG: hypothetical protein AAGI23_07115 [Bacteroidota bacterium]